MSTAYRPSSWRSGQFAAVSIPLIERLIQDPTDRQELAVRLAESPDGFAMRAPLRKVIPLMARVQDPDVGDEVESIIATLPKRAPFSYAPLEELLLPTVYAATRLYPGLGLVERTTEFFIHGFAELERLALFKPLFIACDNDPHTFGEVSSGTGHSIFYNQGSSSTERLGTTRYLARLENVAARAMEPLLHGFACGFIISLTGVRPRVTFDFITARTLEYTVDWSHR